MLVCLLLSEKTMLHIKQIIKTSKLWKSRVNYSIMVEQLQWFLCQLVLTSSFLRPPQEEMTSALATMRVDYEQIKIKTISTQ